MAKITKATFKSFIRKNQGNLFIRCESSFDGMSDMVEFSRNPQFHAAISSEMNCDENTCGLAGVWIVGGTRNRFSKYEDDQYVGIHCYNCCGSFTVVVKK